MAQFIARRLVWMVFVLWGMTLVTFVVANLVPADPARAAAGVGADAATIEQFRRELGYDRPLPEQYVLYLQRLVHGDLGTSILEHRPVLAALVDYFPATLELTVLSMLVAVFIGVPLGVIAAVKRGQLADVLARLISTIWVGVPVFWLGMLAILLFYVDLGWLPVGGRQSPGFDLPGKISGLVTLDSLLYGDLEAFGDAVKHLVLPVSVLAATRMAVLARVARSAMLDVLSDDYVRTAHAKGLRGTTVTTRHALPNALTPVVTTLGVQFGQLLGGAVLVETIFAWPGLGRYAVNGIINIDYPVVMAVALVSSVVFVLVNLVVDVSYVFLDPRVRY